MTNKQKLELRMTKVREQLAAASDPESGATPESIGELENELRSLNSKLSAAILADGDDDQGDDEPAERDVPDDLADRCYVGEYLAAALEGRSVQGAELELTQELDLADINVLPAALILPELRADANTPAPSTATQTQSEIGADVKAPSLLDYLRVRRETVPAGSRTWPILTTVTTAAPTAEGTAKDSTAGAFTVMELSPVRVPARYTFSVEDAATFRGMERALRRDLRALIDEELSDMALNGSGTSPQPTGVIAAKTAPSTTTTVVTTATWASKVAGGVDGQYAEELSQVRGLVNVATYQKLSSLFQNAGGLNIANMAGDLGGLRASSLMPAAASDNADVLLIKTLGPVPAVMPIWSAISLIRDPYSGAASGDVAITATALVNFAVVRAAAYVRETVHLA